MIKIFLQYCFILSLLFYANTTAKDEIYEVRYQLNSLNEANSEIEKLFFNNMLYTIVANEDVCYLKSASILEKQGIYTESKGNEHVYINYKNQNVFFDFSSSENFIYRNIKFSREKNVVEKIEGFDTEKYVSEDGNLIIYTSTKLPWYVQPCIFNQKTLNAGVIKFINLKSKYEMTLVDYNKSSNKTDNHIKKVLSRQKINGQTEIICPLFE